MAQTWWTEGLPNLGFSSPTEFQILVSGLRPKGATIRQHNACVFGKCVAPDPKKCEHGTDLVVRRGAPPWIEQSIFEFLFLACE